MGGGVAGRKVCWPAWLPTINLVERSPAAGLEAGASGLVSSVRENVRHPAFVEMLGAINEVLDDETQANRHSFVNRTQHCFAVRNGSDGLLDVARAAFCRVTEETHALVASYRAQASAEIKVPRAVHACDAHLVTPTTVDRDCFFQERLPGAQRGQPCHTCNMLDMDPGQPTLGWECQQRSPAGLHRR